MTKAQQYELQALRVDSNQLARMATTINAAMPHHHNAMGGESDHAEVALGALIKERDALLKVAKLTVEAWDTWNANEGDGSPEPEYITAARDTINQSKP